MLDLVVDRRELKAAIARVLRFAVGAAVATPAPRIEPAPSPAIQPDAFVPQP